MIHSVFQVVLGYLLWKKFPSWLRLNNSKTIDHYIIVALSLVGIVMILSGGFRLFNGSLKFEITAKRLYAASQRVL